MSETLPRICLFSPSGEREWFDDCVISDSLIPDLSFEGTSVLTGARVRILTNRAYDVVRYPVAPVPYECVCRKAEHHPLCATYNEKRAAEKRAA